ncbi:MAG TPA: hypothetical protein VH951_11965, partial [Dehalococcoidia bacterium]
GRSGATIRRWESNTKTPSETDIARFATAACLTSQQVAFLSAACTRQLATPPPDERAFKAYMREVLSSTPYPAMLIDGLYYIRAWNSHVDALAPGTARGLRRDLHPIAMLLRTPSESLFRPDDHMESLRQGLRIFWMNTAIYSRRPEYARLVARLADEPHFRDLWLELALGEEHAPREPITAAGSIGGSGAKYRVYSRPISFPPAYHLHEYQPDDDLAQSRLAALVERGPTRVEFAQRLHWVDVDDCG